MRIRELSGGLATVLAVCTAVLVVGGVLRWTQALVAVFAAVAVASLMPSRRSFARVSPLVAMLGLAAGLCAIQLVPLPHALLEILNPTSAALRADGAALVGSDSSSTLTNDVPATLSALVFFLTLLGIAITCLRYATTERGRYRILASVTLLCGLTATLVGIHALLGLDSWFGLYKPTYVTPVLLGPLLNVNSLACLMGVGAMTGIGLASYRAQRGWVRVLWLAIVAACGAITVSTISRGATLAFAAGAFVTLGVIVAQRIAPNDGNKKRRSRFLTTALPIGVVAGCMVLLVIWMNAGNVERQLSQLSFDELHYSRSKFAAWSSSMHLVEESPWLGTGRGAFEPTFTRVHPASGIATYSHLENEYLQAVVDWGVLGAVALGVLALWFSLVALRRWREGPLTAGALGAIAVVAIQSNVDFGVELLGLAVPITAIAATLAYVPLRESRRPALGKSLRGVHAGALLAGALLLLSSHTTGLDEDHRTVASHPTPANIAASLRRHPLDYYSYAVLADRMDKRDNARAVRVLNHAMRLHPTHPDLHRLAARMLLREGFTDQATIEYAAALRATMQPRRLVVEILEKFPKEKAATAIPVDFPDVVLMVQTIVDLGHTDVAVAWLERVLQQHPSNARACEQLVQIAASSSPSAAAIAAKRCIAQLPDYQTRLQLAGLLVQAQQFELVAPVLYDVEAWQSRVDDKIGAWLMLCDSYSSLGQIDEAKRCLRRLDASPDMRQERAAEIMTRLEALKNRETPIAIPPSP
jgi:O-antigen ligase